MESTEVNLEELAYLAEVVASVALVLSLIYVSIQVRQSNISTRLAAVRAVQASIGSLEENFISDPGLADLLHCGMTGAIEDLPDRDRIRLSVFYRHSLRTFQSAHYHYRKGALEKSIWEPEARALAGILEADLGMREHFNTEKFVLDPEFVKLCEQLMRGEVTGRLSTHPGYTPKSAD